MNKTKTILKPYLRKFILQTHPDFFHNDSCKKKVNAASLQKLYNVLQPDQDQAMTTCQLEFYIKQQQNKKKEQPKAIARFDPKDSEWIKTSAFLGLCKQVDISILQSDMDMVQDMISKEANKHKPKNQYKSLTREFAERLYKQHNEEKPTTIEWKASQILGHKLVMFDPQVNKKAFSNTFSQYLPQLQPENWWGKVPLMVISPSSVLPSRELTQGILVVKSDMDLKDLKNYINTHLESVIKNQP